MYCDLYCFGLTIYIMHFYWVSLGWFYLLDIHCDYSLISPLGGVAPTPDCGIIISAFSARGVIQTLVWHPVFYFGIFLSICVHHGFSYIFVTDVWSSVKSGVCWIYYTRVLNVCEYIQTDSLACPWLLSWPDCLAWRCASRWHPWSLRVDVCSLAKIGVILVSCSCGKWSPIDADVSNRFRPQPLETKCCTPWPKWSCTTYFCSLLGILVSSWYLIS